MHFESGVGHIGGNLSCIDILIVLFHKLISSEDKFKRADRAVMESLGVLGFIPFYKDVKSYRTRNDYVTKPKQKPINTPKNFNY